MSLKERVADSIILEDSNIKQLAESSPQTEVGVSVNRIYIQIAKNKLYANREDEIVLLYNALSNSTDKKTLVDAVYAIMSVESIMKCFGNSLNKLPKSTFIRI